MEIKKVNDRVLLDMDKKEFKLLVLMVGFGNLSVMYDRDYYDKDYKDSAQSLTDQLEDFQF